jgi:hypothetical protein
MAVIPPQTVAAPHPQAIPFGMMNVSAIPPSYLETLGSAAAVTLARIYEGALLTGAAVSLVYMRATSEGQIKSIAIHLGVAMTGTAVFNVRVNGTAIFATGSRPTIGSGQSSVTVSALAVDVIKGDVITLDLDDPGTSGVNTPVSFMVDVE